MFSPEGTSQLSYTQNTRRHFSTTLGDHFKQVSPTKKCGKCGTKQTMKRTLIHSTSTETRSQSVALSNLSWERARVTQIFRHEVLRVLIFMLQINISKLENASIQNPQKMKTDCPSDTSTACHFSFSLLLLYVGERP